MAALHPLPEHLTQSLLWTFSSTHPQPISSARSPLCPPRYYTVSALRLAQRAEMFVGFTVRAGVGRARYLAESQMDRKLITRLNCLSVSPMGCPSHSSCCSAGIGEEAIGIRQRAQWQSRARLQGRRGHSMSRASPPSPSPMGSACRAYTPRLTSTEPQQQGSDVLFTCCGRVPQTKARCR